jgi:class 3 adenylate cyclase
MDSARPVGILFADIVGSTQMYTRLGDARALAVVTQCFETMARAVTGQGGQVVKTIGDEMMAAFPTSDAALLAAMDIRRAMATLPPVPDSDPPLRPRVRIGLHHGPALFDNDDWYGDTVNLAARVAAVAASGQVLTTGELRDSLPPPLRALTTEFAEIEVKGRRDPVRIARVAEDQSGPETTLIRVAPATAAPVPEASLRLVQNRRSWIVPAGTRSVVCGREAGCDVALSGALASRRHATIEIRRDKVVLVDHSTNGIWLMVDDERPVRLLREEFGMTRTGRIVFGNPQAADADILQFTVA